MPHTTQRPPRCAEHPAWTHTRRARLPPGERAPSKHHHLSASRRPRLMSSPTTTPATSPALRDPASPVSLPTGRAPPPFALPPSASCPRPCAHAPPSLLRFRPHQKQPSPGRDGMSARHRGPGHTPAATKVAASIARSSAAGVPPAASASPAMLSTSKPVSSKPAGSANAVPTQYVPFPPTGTTPVPLQPHRLDMHRCGRMTVHFRAPVLDAHAFSIPLPCHDIGTALTSLHVVDPRQGAAAPRVVLDSEATTSLRGGGAQACAWGRGGEGNPRANAVRSVDGLADDCTDGCVNAVILLAADNVAGIFSVSYTAAAVPDASTFDILHALTVPNGLSENAECVAQLRSSVFVRNPVPFDLVDVELRLCDGPFRTLMSGFTGETLVLDGEERPYSDIAEREDMQRLKGREENRSGSAHTRLRDDRRRVAFPEDGQFEHQEVEELEQSADTQSPGHEYSGPYGYDRDDVDENDFQTVRENFEAGGDQLGGSYVQAQSIEEEAIGSDHDDNDEGSSEFDYTQSTTREPAADSAREKLPPFEHIFPRRVTMHRGEALRMMLQLSRVTAWREHSVCERDEGLCRVLRVRNDGRMAIEAGHWTVRLQFGARSPSAQPCGPSVPPCAQTTQLHGVAAVRVGAAISVPLRGERSTLRLRKDVSGWRGRETPIDVRGSRLRTHVERYRLLQFELDNRDSCEHVVGVAVEQQEDASLRGETEARLLEVGSGGKASWEAAAAAGSSGVGVCDASDHVTQIDDDPPGFVRFTISVGPGARRMLQVRQSFFTESEHDVRDGCDAETLWRLGKCGAGHGVMSGLRELSSLGWQLRDDLAECRALEAQLRRARAEMATIAAAQTGEGAEEVSAAARQLDRAREARRVLGEAVQAVEVRRAEAVERRSELLVEIWGMLASQNGALDGSGV